MTQELSVDYQAPPLEKALQGDEEAFASLVDRYQGPVYNLCYRMLGDSNEAEEAAQETFLRAYLGIKSYDRAKSFSTWLLSIAAHYCIDRLRRRKMTLVPFETLPYEGYVSIPELVNSDVVLTNTQRVYAPEIADHALAMLLAFTRGLRWQIPHQEREASWGLPRDFKESQFIELQGKSILVVGLGGIGTEVARRAHAFGVTVLATDPKVSEGPSLCITSHRRTR